MLESVSHDARAVWHSRLSLAVSARGEFFLDVVTLLFGRFELTSQFRLLLSQLLDVDLEFRDFVSAACVHVKMREDTTDTTSRTFLCSAAVSAARSSPGDFPSSSVCA